MFGIQGLLGYLLLVVVLVTCLVVIGYEALVVQQEQATNYYTVEAPENAR